MINIQFYFCITGTEMTNINEKPLHFKQGFCYLYTNQRNKDMSKLMQDSETWKDIPSYEGIYQISNNSQVKSLRSGKKLTISFVPYGFVKLCVNGVAKKHYVHRLVAVAFIPNPENKSMINHKDGDKRNNAITNLEWCDAKHNVKHAYESNLMPSCENHSRAKFTNDQVRQMRLDRSNGLSRKFIMQKFNLSKLQYTRIIYRKTWKHI